MSKIKVYLSDEGYGHLVRQVAIHKALIAKEPGLEFLFQTSHHLERLKHLLPDQSYSDRFNNIVWEKNGDGTPNNERISQYFSDYESRKREYLLKESEDEHYDLSISDFVYEAFDIAAERNIPSFGVAHFTWEWFFGKLYPPPLSRNLINTFLNSADKATKLFFPPFTPGEILTRFKKNSVQIPLIVNLETSPKLEKPSDKFTILFIDSGAGIMQSTFQSCIKSLENSDEFFALGSEKILPESTRYFHAIPREHLLVDYINVADLVIGRAGFNTISECIAYRTPMLLLGEANNPEMLENIMELKRQGLASFVAREHLEKDALGTLKTFIDSEYPVISERMQSHEMGIDGADVVAREILNSLA